MITGRSAGPRAFPCQIRVGDRWFAQCRAEGGSKCRTTPPPGVDLGTHSFDLGTHSFDLGTHNCFDVHLVLIRVHRTRQPGSFTHGLLYPLLRSGRDDGSVNAGRKSDSSAD